MKQWIWVIMSACLALLLCAGPALAEADASEQVDSLLAKLVCPAGACTYVVAIIDSHPAERDALLAMDEAALPALCQVLLESERGRKTSMAEFFIDEILSRHRDEEPSDASLAARAALLAYTGNEYKPHSPNPNWAK